jgi:hypothetical protein
MFHFPSLRKHSVSATVTSRLIVYREMTSVSCENQTKIINTLAKKRRVFFFLLLRNVVRVINKLTINKLTYYRPNMYVLHPIYRTISSYNTHN